MTALVSPQELARFLNIEGRVPSPFAQSGSNRIKETVGTGDNSTTVFYLNDGKVLSNTFTIYAGTSEPGASALTETTHYTIDKDLGKITLTTAGRTQVGTATIYAEYSFCNIDLTDTQFAEVITRAQKEFERATSTAFTDGTAATPDYIQVQSEKHSGKGRWNRDYFLDHFPLPDVHTNLTSDITAAGTSIPVDSTNGFPSSGTIVIETEKITYPSKNGSAFVNVTRGVDESTGAIHLEDELVSPNCIEISTTSPGTGPSWSVLDEDASFDIDLDTGKVHIYKEDVLIDSVSPTTYRERDVPNRFRATYLYGYNSIPDDVKQAVLMIAAKELLHKNARKALSNGFADFRPETLNIDEEWIQKKIEQYRSMKVSNV
jgi:hypothetical protein